MTLAICLAAGPGSAFATNTSAVNASAPAIPPGNGAAAAGNGPDVVNTLNAQPVAEETTPAENVRDADVNDEKRGGDDDWGWLKVVVGGLLGAATVLATQWITARTNRKIAAEQAEISRSAVNVASEAAKASALGASAAVESAGAARENAAVAGRNADNQGIHAVARLRQEWINTVRDELSKLHALLANYRAPPPKESPAQRTAREQRQREANQSKARLALLLNPREIPSRNLQRVVDRLDDATLLPADRARWARWIVRWGQILLKEEWDRVRAELRGEKREGPFRRER